MFNLPPLTKALMLICVGVFCLNELVPLGPLFALWPLASGNFMPWQVVTYGLLHASILHLVFNMLGLWMFGADLERLWGPKRHLQFIAASVLAGALAQIIVTAFVPTAGPTVGISGGLYGLLLGYALQFPRRQFDLVGLLPMFLLMLPFQIAHIAGIVLYVLLLTNRAAIPIGPKPVPAMTMVAIFGAIELYLGVTGTTGIAHFAHLGGMLGGYLMLRYWRSSGRSGRR
jgi:membrane associated rhomboid family serine protease